VEAPTPANSYDISAATMNRIAKAAEKIERLEPRLDEARRELHQAIRDARAEGADMATIARVAGLSRERIRQIVRK
jgi:DNA-binding phage protein